MNPPFSILFPLPGSQSECCRWTDDDDEVVVEASKKALSSLRRDDWLDEILGDSFAANHKNENQTPRDTRLNTTESHDNWADTTKRWIMDRVAMPSAVLLSSLLVNWKGRSSRASELWGVFVSVRNDLSLLSLFSAVLLRVNLRQRSEQCNKICVISSRLNNSSKQRRRRWRSYVTSLSRAIWMETIHTNWVTTTTRWWCGWCCSEEKMQQLLLIPLTYPINFC